MSECSSTIVSMTLDKPINILIHRPTYEIEYPNHWSPSPAALSQTRTCGRESESREEERRSVHIQIGTFYNLITSTVLRYSGKALWNTEKETYIAREWARSAASEHEAVVQREQGGFDAARAGCPAAAAAPQEPKRVPALASVVAQLADVGEVVAALAVHAHHGHQGSVLEQGECAFRRALRRFGHLLRARHDRGKRPIVAAVCGSNCNAGQTAARARCF